MMGPCNVTHGYRGFPSEHITFWQAVKTDPDSPSSVLTQTVFQILPTVGTSKPVPKIKYKAQLKCDGNVNLGKLKCTMSCMFLETHSFFTVVYILFHILPLQKLRHTRYEMFAGYRFYQDKKTF